MEKEAKKTYYIGILLPSGESCVSTGKKAMSEFLDVHRNTISNNLSQQPYYQCDRYILCSTTDIRKMGRHGLNFHLNNKKVIQVQ